MEQKQAIADRLKQSNNILVTVSNNPSVDQLASCIGMTLALNKMGKHATAVFSGAVPNTIEFLQPEKTIEKNTDSLRDFIIALDKSKADKLRYKVEDKVVKIFITPYRTSITDKDLQFSQGDFNVDVVLALGVHQQADLDQAIIAHGRILHDAVVATINTKAGGELGSINWVEPQGSSLCELVAELFETVDSTILDGQMATALLTGIVAETQRFRNEKTTPTTMSISAELMSAGANQQLVATKLEEPVIQPVRPPTPPPQQEESTRNEPEDSHTTEDGTLEINHPAGEEPAPAPILPPTPPPPAPEPKEEKQELPAPQIHIDDQGSLRTEQIEKHENDTLLGGPSIDPTQHMSSSHMILEPPSMGGQMAASAMPEDMSSTDPLSAPQQNGQGFGEGFGPAASATITPPDMPYLPPSMTPGGTVSTPPQSSPVTDNIVSSPLFPAPGNETPASVPAPSVVANPVSIEPSTEPQDKTLTQLENDVNSPHVQPTNTPVIPPPQIVAPTVAPPVQESNPTPVPSPTPDLNGARDAVMQALAAQPEPAIGPEPIQALNAQPLGEPLHVEPTVIAPPPVNYDATANPTFTLPDVNPPGGSNDIAPPAMPPPIMPQGG